MDGVTRAIIYCPDRRGREQRCRRYCRRKGYEVVAVVTDADGGWRYVLAMLAERQADVVVVASRDDLSPDRVPRLEEAI
jgi:hypothetical protein